MLKKKSILGFVLAICLIVPAMFMLSACGDGDKNPLLGTWNTYQIVTIDGSDTITNNIGDKIGEEVVLSAETYQFIFNKDGTSTLKAHIMIGNGTWVENSDKTITGTYSDPENSKEKEIVEFTLSEDGNTLSAIVYEEGTVGETGYSKTTIILKKVK